MLPQEIIARKRDGEAIPPKDIRSLVLGFARDEVPDYQMAAFAMAICIQGMDFEETCSLTEAMIESGERLDFTELALFVADKHSTGGIGDKVSLILAPLVASCGLAVPMISGRGLALTGGTLDKLESISGFRTDLTASELRCVVDECGCAITGQTEELAPADKKLYALRDVTGTVPSVPLITASILCKKLAAGVNGLVLDVKCGSGSFMKTRDDACELARTMVAVGTRANCKVEALVTDMNVPLGHNVGNALEVQEAVKSLKGVGPADLLEITLSLANRMLAMAGKGCDDDERHEVLSEALSSGRAFERFLKMVELQGGDPGCLESPDRLPSAEVVEIIPAETSGYVDAVDADKVGRVAFLLGSGRERREEEVDSAVGVSDLRQVGESVERGEPLARIHANSPDRLKEARELLVSAFRLSEDFPNGSPLILDAITPEHLSDD